MIKGKLIVNRCICNEIANSLCPVHFPEQSDYVYEPTLDMNVGHDPETCPHCINYVYVDQPYDEWLKQVESYQGICMTCGKLVHECACNTHVLIDEGQTGNEMKDIISDDVIHDIHSY